MRIKKKKEKRQRLAVVFFSFGKKLMFKLILYNKGE